MWPPVSLWFPGMAAMCCLILASGFFSASETALFYLSHDELRGMRTGTARERMAAELLRRADRLLTAVLFWNLVINLTYFATSVVVAQRLFRAAHGVCPRVRAGGIVLHHSLWGSHSEKRRGGVS